MGKIKWYWLSAFLLIIGVFFGVTQVQAIEKNKIKVNLSKGSYSAPFRVVQGNYILKNMETMLPIADLNPGDLVTINQAGKIILVSINETQLTGSFAGAIIATPKDENKLNVFSYKNTLYRDGISIAIDSGSLLVVNNVNIEHYLYGVVGQEMGYTAPEEALKTQAVVSRTYALFFKGKNRKFDVGTDTYYQVYGGYSAEQNIHAKKIIDAVNATAGQVIFYNNKKSNQKEIIEAVFHSNAGGYTENCENVWNEAVPYLAAISSPEDKYAEKYSTETGDSWPLTCYRWEKSFSPDQIKAALISYNQKTANSLNIGEFQDLKIYRNNRDGITPTPSGRVTRMEFIGSKGKANVYRDNIRSVFGLKSTKFDLVMEEGSKEFVIKDSQGEKHRVNEINNLMIIDGQNNLTKLDLAPETCQIIGATGVSGNSGTSGLSQANSGITFIGQGNGHGIGMSQWGARGMAIKGCRYPEIINHYYNQGKNDGMINIEVY